MDNNYDHTELIEKFLNGELTGSELESFKLLLESDEQLRGEIAIEQKLQEVYAEEEALEFRKKLTEIRGLSETKKGIIRLFTGKQKHLAAASIIILAAIAILLILNQKHTTNQELFAEYFTPYPADTEYRSGDTELTKEEQALKLYAEGKYREANVIFKDLPVTDKLKLYHSLSLDGAGQTGEAITQLQEITRNSSGPFAEQARWYLALFYLKEGQTAQCEQLLKIILNNKQFQHQEAAELLKKNQN
ncbi:MAG: hypothetical protein K8R53_10420 [Bacteroidales bacterium]|nr:hypothetical protein [Bacteroidales bacterium]